MMIKTPVYGMIRHRTGVKNQFLFDGGKGKTACLAISVQAIYHMHEYLTETGALPGTNEWTAIMTRGIRLWELWRDTRGKIVRAAYPTIDEVISMKECEGFYRLFNERITEYAGLVIDNKRVEDHQASLGTTVVQSSLESMVTKLMLQQSSACIIAVLPSNCSVGIVRYNDSVFLFDPHGSAGSNDCELMQFRRANALVDYLVKKYQLDVLSDTYTNTGVYYNEMEIQDTYGYCAILFSSKK